MTRARKKQPPKRGLTEKQARFVEEYVIDFNATQAAIRAGFSAKTAYSQGQRLLKNVEVAAAVRERRTRLSQRAELTAERVLAEYAKVAFSRITNYVSFGPDGVLLQESSMIEGEALDAIAEVREHIGAEGALAVSFKLHSKLDALNALGKHYGLFVDKHEIDISKRMSDALNEIKARLSPEAQEELVRAVGTVLAEAVAPTADSNGSAA